MRLVALLLCALVGQAAANGVLLSGLRAKHLLKLHKPVPVVSAAPAAAGGAGMAAVGGAGGAAVGMAAVGGAGGVAAGGAGMGGVTTPMAVPAACLSAAEVATKAGNFTTLLAAAKAAGLADTLSNRALRATVFAPSDAAFAATLADLNLTPSDLLAEPNLLQAILKYHVVPGVALSLAELRDSMQLPTLLTADLAASASAAAYMPSLMSHTHSSGGKSKPPTGTLSLTVLKVYDLHSKEQRKRVTVVGDESSADVVAADINFGCPTIIHVIDSVLLPTVNATQPEADSGMMGMGKLLGAAAAGGSAAAGN